MTIGSGAAARPAVRTVGTELPVRDGDFVVKYDGGKIMVEYKGSKREAPVVDLLDQGFKIALPDVDDGRALRTMSINRGNTPEEIEVEAVMESLRVKYETKGTLTRK